MSDACAATVVPMVKVIDGVVTLLWLVLATVSVVVSTQFGDALKAVSLHGKVLATNEQPKHLSHWWQDIRVPKSYFTHMYVLGTLVGGLSVLVPLLQYLPSHWSHWQCVAPTASTVMFLLQSIRRLWECRSITLFGTSQIHLGGYLVGMLHYTVVPLTLWVSEDSDLAYYRYNTAVSIGIFAIASYYQYQHHKILYCLKKEATKARKEERPSSASNKSSHHLLPKGLGFAWVCCPHYTLEIIIYLCFNLLRPYSLSRWAMTGWVVCNLSVVADHNLHWYHRNYGADDRHKESPVKFAKWKRIIPFVW